MNAKAHRGKLDKYDLITLEKSAHLSLRELRKQDPKLANRLETRFEDRARRMTADLIGEDSRRLRKLVDRMELPLGDDPDKVMVREATLKALRAVAGGKKKLAKSKKLRKELDALEERWAGLADENLAEALQLDEPLATHPEFRPEIEAARLYELGDAAGLKGKTAAVLVDEVGEISALNDDRLAELVDAKKLSDDQAKAAGMVVSLYHILDERPELVAAVKPGLDDVRDLVSKDEADWEAIIKSSGTRPPGGVSVPEYAEALGRKVEGLFPTDALVGRLTKVDAGATLKGHGELDELRRLNPSLALIGGGDFGALNTGSIAEGDLKALRDRYEGALRLANRYHGMDLAAVLDDSSLPEQERTREVERRVSLVNRFFADNTDVLDLDLTPGSDDVKALTFGPGATDTDMSMVLTTARAYQRALVVTDDIGDAEAIVVGGFPSALSMAMVGVDEVAARTRLSVETVAPYYDRAREIASGVTAHLGTVSDLFYGGFNDTAVGNVSPGIQGFLNELPGFADFFGNQDFCQCKHCRSILGPAAYFVDLMSFVEERVTKEHFAGKADHPLNLRTRRPDLWALELTCENTNTPIPYLVIINEILENAVAQEAGFAGDVGDRAAVEEVVYEDTLPDQVDSFGQPFHLSFEELRVFLAHFERTLADMAEAGGATGDALARLRLDLPPREYQLITLADDSMPFLRRIYGIQFTESAGAIEKFDAQELLEPMGVSREELSQLVGTRFVTDDGALEIQIQGEKRDPESIQNDIERIQGLTRTALDRMHRFVRLWRATGWRIGELDLVLSHLRDEGIGSGIDVATVGAVARLHRMGQGHDLSVEELVALWSNLPQQAVVDLAATEGGHQADDEPPVYPQLTPALAHLTTPLLDRLFNQPHTAHPGLAVIATSGAPVSSTAAGDTVTYTATIDGTIEPADSITFAANAALDDVVSDWNSQAQSTEAYRSDASGIASVFGDHLSIRTKESIAGNIEIEITQDSAAILTTALPAVFSVEDDGQYPQDGTTFLHPALASVPPAEVDPNLHRLLAGTGTDEDQLYQLIVGLARPLGIDPNAATDDHRAFPLSHRNLSLLYRHARLARLLGVTVPELFALAALAPEIALAHVGSIDDLETLIRTYAWWQGTNWSIADLVRIVSPGTAAVATSAAPVTSTAAGDEVTYVPTIHGIAQAAETITFAANATLDDVVADWNSQAQLTEAYRSDALGIASALGDRLSFRTREGTGSSARIEITADSAAILTATTPAGFAGVDHEFASRGPEPSSPADLAQQLVDQVEGAETLLFADTVFAFLDEITEADSRAIVADNAAVFEVVDAEGRLRLMDSFDPNVALTLPAGADLALEPQLRDVLKDYHSQAVLLSILPGRLGIAPDVMPELVHLVGEDLDDATYFRELRMDTTPPQGIAALIARLQRLGLLFSQDGVFDVENLAFVESQAALFGVVDWNRLDLDSVRRLEIFRALLAPWLDREEETPDLKAALLAFDPAVRFGNADQEALAELLGADVALLNSLQEHLNLGTTPFEVMETLSRAIPLAQHLGAGGAVLKLVQSEEYDDLATASAAIQAAFRTKYEDEAEWEQLVEPFQDELLSRQRDGLVAYLVHSGAPQFDEVTDLYHYYLLDVELEGCARTSRVAAAIASVQLYVQRILMNLERTPPGDADPVHVVPQSIPADEWEWRKNYRVWEANRKIFLYPENWLEPELRDNKTPLFEALEEELLAKEITEEAVLDAYGRYLRGFDELAHLKIAGSYHEKDKDAKRDTLHLFGVTGDDPPVYYYRRVEDAHYGVSIRGRATHWGPWEQVDIQIPVRKVAPIVHNGQLYVFWVRYTTKPLNEIQSGSTRFGGYQHRAYVEFSKRRLDGSWTTPQAISLDEDPFRELGAGVIPDPIVGRKSIVDSQGNLLKNSQPLHDDKIHRAPQDGYTLSGFGWDQLYPETREKLYLRGADFQMWSGVDLYHRLIEARAGIHDGVPWLRPVLGALVLAVLFGSNEALEALQGIMSKFPERMVWSRQDGSKKELHSAPTDREPAFEAYTLASLILEETRFENRDEPLAQSDLTVWKHLQWSEDITDALEQSLTTNLIGRVPAEAELDVVNGSVGDVIIQTDDQVLYLQSGAHRDGRYHLRRLNTSVSEEIASTLFNRGLEALLATDTQLGLAEANPVLTITGNKIVDATESGTLDYDGSMGVYLREIFFHIPFTIANHLNSQGKFEEAQRWYHTIFDPTAAETVENLPANLSEEERRRRELDRNWRYREFREVTLKSFRCQLANETAIGAYRRDPFNPHAIARLRMSAFQKAIVMKYVDNLLDWGDHLFALAFAALNPEYLREATTVYVMAQEILGKRPARLGDCGEGKIEPKVFPTIKRALGDGSGFLMEIEYISVIRDRPRPPGNGTRPPYVFVGPERARLATTTRYAALQPPPPPPPPPGTPTFTGSLDRLTREDIRAIRASVPPEAREAAARFRFADTFALTKPSKAGPISVPGFDIDFEHPRVHWLPDFGISIVREYSPIFCVPGNERLLGYWDRVEDRLYKLRNCMDIEGVVRQLPLFAPPIDPGLLARARAAGLSLDEILGTSGGSLPPYRFRYLLEKARAFAVTVQGFGAALLSALEKRDAEELARIRNVHQKNILRLTTEVRQNELKIAQENVKIVRRRQEAAQFRHDYYEGLISSGLSNLELIQSISRIAAAEFRTAAAGLDTLASVSHLIPEVGSAFAMKYGGLQLGNSADSWSKVSRSLAEIADGRATIAGIRAGFSRREQGWQYQQDLAEHELKTIERELVTAELREAIAKRNLQLHEKVQEQHDEVIEYYGDKFTNLGLYTYLSRSLQQLFREAYSNALALAQLAEQAYHFERPRDGTRFVGGEWDASRSGLLAGERLTLNLQRMDRRFIETNDRRYEINQSFSLAQIDPEALIALKETGACEFSLPEFYFDLFYPGQYHRWIRGVRLTIPCITGPYTNVSAKLTLLKSHVRSEPLLGAANLTEVPPSRTVSVATSTAQGDAGVFELSFRDERYMPFEGAGAVSEWRLELPSSFKLFDYQSINDVILNLSYTAEDDGMLRQAVEAQNGALETFLANNTLTRVFSLRQEFSNAYNRLMQAAAGTPLTIDITERHFPMFLQGRDLTAVAADVVLSVEEAQAVDGVSLSVNGTDATAFARGAKHGGLPSSEIATAFAAGLKEQHTITVSDAGVLGSGGGAGAPLFDQEKLQDILLVVEYRL